MTTTLHTPLKEWAVWHARREAELAEPYGWLTLTHFAWLPSAPTSIPDLPGRWWADDQGALVSAEPAEGLLVDGAVLDGTASAVVAEAGSTTWAEAGDRRVELLLRGGGVRPAGAAAHHPLSEAFNGVPTFPYDPSAVVDATWTAVPERTVDVATARPDLTQQATVVGELTFLWAGESQRLAATRAGGGRSVLFHDPTNHHETAPWRLVALPEPDGDDRVRLDLNRAVNLPFAFTAYGTCPAPVAGNRITAPVRAGERSPR